MQLRYLLCAPDCALAAALGPSTTPDIPTASGQAGERVPAFAELTWNNGFMMGWIAAQTRKAARDEGLRAKGGGDGAS